MVDWFSTNIWDSLVALVTDPLGTMFGSLGTVWVDTTGPALTVDDAGPATAPAAPVEQLATILSWVTWIGLAVCVVSLIVLGARLALAHQHGDTIRSLGRFGMIMVVVVLVSSAGSLAAYLVNTSTTGTPGDPGTGPGAAGGAAGFLQGSLWWVMIPAVTLSVLIGGIKTAIDQRASHLHELGKALLRLVLVAGMGVAVVSLLTIAADEFSKGLITASLNCPGTEAACFSDKMMGILHVDTMSAMPAGFVIITGLVALVSSMILIGLMFVRSAMLIVLVGILPVSASLTNTEGGRVWFSKVLGWTAAFILYKPAAAIVYAAAFQLVAGDEMVQTIQGVVLMLLAIMALPALMKLAGPAVGALGGGGTGTGWASSATPTGAVAIGRITADSRRGRVRLPLPGETAKPDGAMAIGPAGGLGLDQWGQSLLVQEEPVDEVAEALDEVAADEGSGDESPNDGAPEVVGEQEADAGQGGRFFLSGPRQGPDKKNRPPCPANPPDGSDGPDGQVAPDDDPHTEDVAGPTPVLSEARHGG